MGSLVERPCGKVVAGRPSEVANCGMGQARLQLADDTGGGQQTLKPHIHA